MGFHTYEQIGAQPASREPYEETGEILLVSVRVPGEGPQESLQHLTERAGCRLYRALDGAGAFVIAGLLEALGRLRGFLLAEKSLCLVREAVEEALGRHAAPAGAPPLDEARYKRTEVVDDLPVPAGTRLLVTRDFFFDAAHNLPRYNGKCEALHGHTFRLRVTVEAPLDAWSGMAFDFHHLKKIVGSRVVKILDHTYLNEHISNPSAENITIWAWQQLSDLPLKEITVWETPSCFVTYRGPARA